MLTPRIIESKLLLQSLWKFKLGWKNSKCLIAMFLRIGKTNLFTLKMITLLARIGHRERVWTRATNIFR